MNKPTYTIKKAYVMTDSGAEKVIWNIMEGDFVVDSTDLKRDAKYWCDKWNYYKSIGLRE